MAKFLFLFVIIGISFNCGRVESVTCECSYAKCPNVDNQLCPRGFAVDICGCCEVCAGDKGEHCGGPWGIFGKCGDGLFCRQGSCPPDVSESECYLFHLTDPGICIEEKRHSIVDILQGTHLKETGSTDEHMKRIKLLKELENTLKKK